MKLHPRKSHLSERLLADSELELGRLLAMVSVIPVMQQDWEEDFAAWKE